MSYGFTAQAGTDPSMGLGRSDGIVSSFLWKVITWIVSSGVCGPFLVENVSPSHSSMAGVKQPSSSLSSLLVSSGTRHSIHVGFSVSGMAVVLQRAALRAFSFQ